MQLRAIVALARSGDASAATAILPLARDQKLTVSGTETWDGQPDAQGWSPPHQVIPHTALKAVVKLNAIDLLLSQLDNRDIREAALRGLQEIHSEKVIAGLRAKVDGTNDKATAGLITIAQC